MSASSGVWKFSESNKYRRAIDVTALLWTSVYLVILLRIVMPFRTTMGRPC